MCSLDFLVAAYDRELGSHSRVSTHKAVTQTVTEKLRKTLRSISKLCCKSTPENVAETES